MNSGENRCRITRLFRRANARAKSYARNRFRGQEHHSRTVLRANYFQMEMARMMSENLTFAAFESFSVPITMRIAQDSNWA